MLTVRRTATMLTGATVALVLGAGAATAAEPTTNVSTNTAPVAVLLTGAGTSIVTYGIANNRVMNTRAVTGLTGDTSLVGIDYRVQNARMYGVGNAGGLYIVSTTGASNKIKQLTVPLDGTRFGVDFNPVANALRIISNTGQNLRQPFADIKLATVADGALNYTAGVTATGVVAAAYTNNDIVDTSATTLFDIDAGLDQVAVQAPANSGSLSLTGKLGVDVSPNAGFDIFTTLGSDGRATGNDGYVVDSGATSTSFSTVQLLTGKLTSVATLQLVATDIAVIIAQRPAV